MCITIKTTLRCGHSIPKDEPVFQCVNNGKPDALPCGRGAQIHLTAGPGTDARMYGWSDPAKHDDPDQSDWRFFMGRKHLNVNLKHIEHGVSIDLTAADRICEKCRREDLKRPENKREYADVPRTLLPNGKMLHETTSTGSGSRSNSPLPSIKSTAFI